MYVYRDHFAINPYFEADKADDICGICIGNLVVLKDVLLQTWLVADILRRSCTVAGLKASLPTVDDLDVLRENADVFNVTAEFLRKNGVDADCLDTHHFYWLKTQNNRGEGAEAYRIDEQRTQMFNLATTCAVRLVWHLPH